MRITSSWVGIFLLVMSTGGTSTALAADMPPGIADPDKAILDPMYNDPVFVWRITSVPKDIYEPDPYFYWPSAVIAGKPGQFPPQAKTSELTVPTDALEDAAEWAAAHKTHALIIIRNGKVQLERYWNDTRPDVIVNGRAITRSVTPMLLGFAVADGKLALDDPIGKFITEWRDEERGQIKVRHLAQNASGLEVAPQLGLSQIYGNKDLCLAYCGDVVRAAMNYPAAVPPGTRFEVAQENMQLLALVIERAMDTPIQSLLSERVWKHIGAEDATFQLDRPGGTARVMCCMRATPRSWARLGLLILQKGQWEGKQVLPKGWVDIMMTPSERNANFGLGLWLGSPYVPLRTYFEGKPGAIPQAEPFLAEDVSIMEGGGFKANFMVPSHGLLIYRDGDYVDDWDHAYLVNTVLKAIQRE